MVKILHCGRYLNDSTVNCCKPRGPQHTHYYIVVIIVAGQKMQTLLCENFIFSWYKTIKSLPLSCINSKQAVQKTFLFILLNPPGFLYFCFAKCFFKKMDKMGYLNFVFLFYY